MRIPPQLAGALVCALLASLPTFAGCATLTESAASPAPRCARLDVPHQENTVRVRCPDGQQRYVPEGATTSLIDVCYQPWRFPAEPETLGALCVRPRAVHQVATAGRVEGAVEVQIERDD